MMDFNELQIVDNKEEKKAVGRVNDIKRFIITTDPYDPDTIAALAEGKNVFIVYDRLNQKISTKMWTRKTFSEFVDWFLKDEKSKIPYLISTKFINEHGRPCNHGEINPGSKPFERYNDTF